MTIKYFVYEHILSQPLKVVIPPMMHSLIQLSQLRVFRRSQTQKLDSYSRRQSLLKKHVGSFAFDVVVYSTMLGYMLKYQHSVQLASFA